MATTLAEASAHRRRSEITREPVEVPLDTDLLNAAGELSLDVAGACERGLQEAVATERARRWYQENKEQVDKYNAWVEKNGVLLRDLSAFKLDEA